MGSNPTVTAMRTPEKSGVFAYPGWDVVHFWRRFGSALLVVLIDLHAEHGADCGHGAVQHDDHVDYVHDGHKDAPHGAHYDEH